VGAEYTRPLDELRSGDAQRFGGKSASLGELMASGAPVPPGFALSVTAYEAFLEEAELSDRIARELSALDSEDLEALRAASTAVVEAVRAVPLPEAVRAEIAHRYEEGEPPVAVRSSAVGEDSAEATFAGQQGTYLWVRGVDRVCDAVRDCWASLYSPEAMSYRARMPASTPAMGVTVQRMVDAAVSGVVFTCNPVSGDPSTVAVNASWGLGLAVVGGEVTPDEYRVSKVTRELLSKTVGPKQVEYLPDPAGGGTVRADVPAERQEAACLEDEQLEVLVDLALRVESHFGSHQDIEWAIAHDGSLFVLQSRPVTTAPKKSEPTQRRSAISLVMGTFGAADDAGS
jgi:phosphoenolpyruvate synthase/pyruvate phosphate dikinase